MSWRFILMGFGLGTMCGMSDSMRIPGALVFAAALLWKDKP